MPRSKIAGEFPTLAALRHKIVQQRGERCEVPNCETPFHMVQAAHIMPAGQGGHLVIENVMLLCLTHHTRYDSSKWQMPITLLSDETRVYLAAQGYLWLSADGEPRGRGMRRFTR